MKKKNNINVGILQNEDPNSHQNWVEACRKFGVNYTVIDLFANDWLEQCQSQEFDFFLLRPSGTFEKDKKIYDERTYIINKVLGFSIYPTYEECYIYENKMMLRDYLKASEIPHPKTEVFYKKNEAIHYAQKADYPLVAKTNIGASSSGVRVLNDKAQGLGYINKAFSKKGIKRKYGPSRVLGGPSSWIKKSINSPQLLKKKLKKYFSIYSNGESGKVLFQEFIPHDYEWRAVKIGESYFAHKKTLYKGKASGSKNIKFVNPPIALLDFIREVCEKRNFNFMSLDLFEPEPGVFLVNELQTIFGQGKYNHIMEVDGEPGRYMYKNGKWIFEKGMFNVNASYNLRLEVALNFFNQNS